MKKRGWLLFSAIMINILSCKKDVRKLPAPSQNGSNIFGCSIDSNLWVPAGFGIIPTAPTLEARGGVNHSIFINARNFSSSPTETEFEIHLYNFTGRGTYPLNETTAKYPSQTASYAYYVRRKMTPENEWITNTQYPGRVEVTAYDSVNRYISGTFEFYAINLYNDPQPLHVTDGRFDVKLQ
ncbi:MAG: hypothetical protein JWM28_1960 [Chitinophagaceae bacterium]|nr:hypothetical protein [Chitinophagaceae bacterium]